MARFQTSAFKDNVTTGQTLTCQIETKRTWKNLWMLIRYGSIINEVYIDIGKMVPISIRRKYDRPEISRVHR
jgi:hypothetical protein